MAVLKEGVAGDIRFKKMTANRADRCGVKNMGGTRGLQHNGCDCDIRLGDVFYWDKTNYIAYCEKCGESKFESNSAQTLNAFVQAPSPATYTVRANSTLNSNVIPTREAPPLPAVTLPQVKLVFKLPLTDTEGCYCKMLDRREKCGYCLALSAMQTEGDLK